MVLFSIFRDPTPLKGNTWGGVVGGRGGGAAEGCNQVHMLTVRGETMESAVQDQHVSAVQQRHACPFWHRTSGRHPGLFSLFIFSGPSGTGGGGRKRGGLGGGGV